MKYLKLYDKYFEVLSNLDTKFTETKYFYFFKVLVNIIIIVIIISLFLLVKELTQGNHPIYSKIYECTVCNDGWISYSGGPGACSWHNGINYYKYKKIETGFYFANAQPSLYTFIICITILIISSTFNKKIRILSVKSLMSIVSNVLIFITIILSPFVILMKNIYLFLIKQVISLKALLKIK